MARITIPVGDRFTLGKKIRVTRTDRHSDVAVGMTGYVVQSFGAGGATVAITLPDGETITTFLTYTEMELVR